MVKLFELRHYEDFGHEYHLILLRKGKWCFFQATFHLNDMGGGPYAQLSLGGGRFLQFMGWAGRLGIDIEIASQVWDLV